MLGTWPVRYSSDNAMECQRLLLTFSDSDSIKEIRLVTTRPFLTDIISFLWLSKQKATLCTINIQENDRKSLFLYAHSHIKHFSSTQINIYSQTLTMHSNVTKSSCTVEPNILIGGLQEMDKHRHCPRTHQCLSVWIYTNVDETKQLVKSQIHVKFLI